MTSSVSKAHIDEKLQGLVGRRLGPYNAFNPVSRTAIWQWCSAMGDRNPLYLDENYHAEHGLDGCLAPPAMMQMWTMRDVNLDYAPGSTDARPYPAIDYLSENGYAGNVAVSYDLRFHRLLREGDQVHHFTQIDSISDLKQTAHGNGYFFTDRMQYFDQSSQLFAEALITYFQYDPITGAAEASAPPTDVPEVETVWQSDHADVAPATLAVGQQLPELAIPITHKLIVSGAMASQDFVSGHHNLEAAHAAAMPDIFMNILTTCGLTGRYLTDWAGAASRIDRITLKLHAPNVPGDSMVFQGSIGALEPGDRGTAVEVQFGGRNSRGFHVSGTAELTLPGAV